MFSPFVVKLGLVDFYGDNHSPVLFGQQLIQFSRSCKTARTSWLQQWQPSLPWPTRPAPCTSSCTPSWTCRGQSRQSVPTSLVLKTEKSSKPTNEHDKTDMYYSALTCSRSFCSSGFQAVLLTPIISPTDSVLWLASDSLAAISRTFWFWPKYIGTIMTKQK